MCLTFFYVNPCPSKGTVSLVVVMNRDEFYDRPTSIADWSGDPAILAGRDMQDGRQGGTWLGMDRMGRIGLLTNIYTGKLNHMAQGRGFLVMDYLQGEVSASDYLRDVSLRKVLYNPFNMCLFEKDPNNDKAYRSVYYCRGHMPNDEQSGPMLEPEGPYDIDKGVHGLGNHPMSKPYLKTTQGKAAFEDIINKYNHVGQKEKLIEAALELMCTRKDNHPDPQMAFQGGSWSAFRDFHQQLSSICVDIPNKRYGTRAQTVIIVDYDDNVTFLERTKVADETNSQWSVKRHDFKAR